MRTMLLVVLAITARSGFAMAQPGQTPSESEQPPAQEPPPMGAPGWQVPQPYNYQPVMVTDDERDLLEQGEIRHGQHIAGGLVATFVGYGIGHMVEGRWSEIGWVFTVGEGAALVAVVAGISEAFDARNHADEHRGTTLAVGGLLADCGLRIWEIVDAWSGPPRHNRRLYELRARLGMPPLQSAVSHVTPYVVPLTAGAGGGVAGVALSF